MRIKSIKVDNFKSLVNFDLPLAKFSCLVGLNGSGKSTILQFLDFLAQQVKGDLSGWLKKRQWEPSDLNSRLTNKRNIGFEILLVLDNNVEIKWSASFNRQTLHCTTEHVKWNDTTILKVEDGDYQIRSLSHVGEMSSELQKKYKKNGLVFEIEIQSGWSEKIAFDYQGSLLSVIKESQLTQE